MGKWRDPEEVESIEDVPDTARESADRAYIRQEMRDCIREMGEKLPEQYRAPLLLSDFEDLANTQIAEILGLSLDTVKIRLHRARVRLRAAMECGCTFYHFTMMTGTDSCVTGKRNNF